MHLSILVLLALLFGALLPSSVAPTPAASDIRAYGAISTEAGWLLTDAQLYLTRDSGATWQDVAPALLPDEKLLAADFIASAEGWAVTGRPAGDEQVAFRLARSSDWGATWDAAPLPLFASGDPDPTVSRVELDFSSAARGALRIRHVSSSNFERWSEWRTVDGGATWARAKVRAETAGAAIPDGASFANAREGWRVERAGSCSGEGAHRVCRQRISLQSLSDGGATWRSLPLPRDIASERVIPAPEGRAEVSAASSGSRTTVAVGQGFDKCEVAKAEQLWDWRFNSPYSAVNLYIGGAMRACANRGLSADYLRYLSSMGWSFIPTWVGPQSPCYGGNKGKMSLDPFIAQAEGWSEAQAAADTLWSLGLTEGDGTGSIVYYDMEYYNTSDASCNAAVQAFVTGWTQGLRTRGNLAGVYGTGSTLRLLANLSPAPDAIWAAHWIFNDYEPSASVWNVYSLSNDLWVNQQRLRQYTGGHPEQWGATTLHIDSDVLDGIVAIMDAPPPPTATSTVTPTPTITSTPTETPTPSATPTRFIFTPTVWHYLPMLYH